VRACRPDRTPAGSAILLLARYVPRLNFFQSPAIDDAVLGRLERSDGQWRGTLDLDGHGPAPLALFGRRREPDAEALAAARLIAPSLRDWQPLIAPALLEHHAPCGEAIAKEKNPQADCSPRRSRGLKISGDR